MLAREVQIDRGLFEIAMAEQDLDRAEIGSSLQQVRREAVPERMRMDVLVRETGTNCRLTAGCPQHLGGHRTARRMPPVTRKQPHRWLVPKPTPVRAQRFKQCRGSASHPDPCGPCHRGCEPPSAGCRCRSPSGSQLRPGVLPWRTGSSPGCAETASRSHR